MERQEHTDRHELSRERIMQIWLFVESRPCGNSDWGSHLCYHILFFSLHSEIEQMKLKKLNYTIWETLTNCSLTVETGGTDQIVIIMFQLSRGKAESAAHSASWKVTVTKLYSWESLTLQPYSTMKQMHQSPQYNVFHKSPQYHWWYLNISERSGE